VTDSNGARNATSGRSNPNSRHHAGVTLNDAIRLWDTPSVAVTEGSRLTRGGDRSDEMLLTGQAIALSEWRTPLVHDSERGPKLNPAPKAGEHSLSTQVRRRWVSPSSALAPPTPDGPTSSPERRTLNPLFVEWLMGWPIGWTASGPVETESSHWWQAMRGELLRLVLRPTPERLL
jgi:hypothetical protein